MRNQDTSDDLGIYLCGDIPISNRIRTQNNLMLNIDWQFSNLHLVKRTYLFTCRKSKIKRPLPELIDTVNGFTTWGLLDSSLIN